MKEQLQKKLGGVDDAKRSLLSLLGRGWSNFYVRHVLLALFVIAFLLLGITLFLNIVTRHGQSFPVPNFTNLKLEDAHTLADDYNLRIELTDSVFIAHKPRGAVIDQNPKPGLLVKKNRKVFVTINSQNSKLMEVPNVEGLSLRQARAVVELHELEIGRLTFRDDMANGNVLEQRHNGAPIAYGKKLAVGSKIDLVVGLNGNAQTAVPSLSGMSAVMAKGAIVEAMLNVGRVRYDESVKTMSDTLSAFVLSQHPAATDLAQVGDLVSIVLTINSSNE